MTEETSDGPVFLPDELGAHNGRDGVRELRERAEAAFVRGDYWQVGKLEREIARRQSRNGALEGDPGDAAQMEEIARGADTVRRQLGLDKVAVAVGLVATLLYLLGWGLSISW